MRNTPTSIMSSGIRGCCSTPLESLPFSCEVGSTADSENETEREGDRHASDYEYWLK
jgi:hypothetical protein